MDIPEKIWVPQTATTKNPKKRNPKTKKHITKKYKENQIYK
jgi:hypothetical protein